MTDHEYVEIEVDEVCQECDNSLRVLIEGETVFIPFSQIEEGTEVPGIGEEGTLCVTRWIADQKGLSWV